MVAYEFLVGIVSQGSEILSESGVLVEGTLSVTSETDTVLGNGREFREFCRGPRTVLVDPRDFVVDVSRFECRARVPLPRLLFRRECLLLFLRIDIHLILDNLARDRTGEGSEFGHQATRVWRETTDDHDLRTTTLQELCERFVLRLFHRFERVEFEVLSEVTVRIEEDGVD